MTTATRCPWCGSVRTSGSTIPVFLTLRHCDECGTWWHGERINDDFEKAYAFYSDATRVADPRPPVKADSTVPASLREMVEGAA